MLLSPSPIERPRRRVRRLSRRNSGLLFLAVPALFPVRAYAAGVQAPQITGGFWAGIAVGLVLVISGVIFSRTRIKNAERATTRATELANHREYERNMAQQELMRRLEEERELAKEKMQFESQLTELREVRVAGATGAGRRARDQQPAAGHPVAPGAGAEGRRPEDRAKRSSSALKAPSGFPRRCAGCWITRVPGR